MRRYLLLLACLPLLLGHSKLGSDSQVPGLRGTTADEETLTYLVRQTHAPGLEHLPKIFVSSDGGQTGSLSSEATASAGNATTFTTTAAHGMQVGDLVDIAGTTSPSYDGRWRINAVSSTTTFTADIPFAGDSGAEGTWTHVTGGRCPGDLPQGIDTNPGTKERPIRSLGRLHPLMKEGRVSFVFDACDTWETNDAGGSGDNESASFLMLGTAGSDQLIVDNDAGSDWGRCSDRDSVCVAFTTTDPTGLRKPVWVPAMLDALDSNMFEIEQAANDIRGWIHVEGFQFGTAADQFPSTCTESLDFYRTDSQARASFLNNKVFMCSEGTNNNEFWTSHNNDAGAANADLFVSINNEIIYPDTGVDGNHPAYFNIANSAIAILGGEMLFLGENTTTPSEVVGLKLSASGVGPTDTYGFVWGNKVTMAMVGDTQSNARGYYTSGTTSDSTFARLVVADSSVTGANKGGAGNSSGASLIAAGGSALKNQDMVLYRVSSYNNDALFGAGAAGMQSGNEWKGTAICTTHSAGAAGTDTIIDHTGGGDCAGLNFDIRDSFVNQSNPNTASIESSTFATIASFCNAAIGCNGGAAWTSCDLTDLTSDPFGTNSGETGLVLGSQVVGACAETLNETFLLGLYIPEYLLAPGQIINAVSLGGAVAGR